LNVVAECILCMAKQTDCQLGIGLRLDPYTDVDKVGVGVCVNVCPGGGDGGTSQIRPAAVAFGGGKPFARSL